MVTLLSNVCNIEYIESNPVERERERERIVKLAIRIGSKSKLNRRIVSYKIERACKTITSLWPGINKNEGRVIKSR